MKTFLKFFIAFIFASILIFLVLNEADEANSLNSQYINLGGEKLKVEVASTPPSRERGLSGRESLNANEAMLFVFDTPGIYSFWMKDMKFPIDIIWLSGEKKIVYIKKNALPDSYPATYTPKDDAKYVLEVVSGFSDKYNIKVGDIVVIQ